MSVCAEHLAVKILSSNFREGNHTVAVHLASMSQPFRVLLNLCLIHLCEER